MLKKFVVVFEGEELPDVVDIWARLHEEFEDDIHENKITALSVFKAKGDCDCSLQSKK